MGCDCGGWHDSARCCRCGHCGSAPAPEICRYTTGISRHLLRRPARDHVRPPRSPPSGPKSITQSADLITSRLCSMISTRRAAVDQFAERRQQLLNVVEVQSGRRLVENIKHARVFLPGEMRRQFQALRLAAGKRGGGLARAADSPVPLRPARAASRSPWVRREKTQRLAHRQSAARRGYFSRCSALPARCS